MPAISSFFLTAALVLAVTIGPQTRFYTWGPALIALGLAVLAALPAFWRRGKSSADFGTMALALLTAGWFAWRAWISPVGELAQADLLLVCAAVGTFVCVRGLSGHPPAERILSWGIALLLLANLAVMWIQKSNPSFAPIFNSRGGSGISMGFFSHYNEAANFLIAATMLTGAAALYGKLSLGERICFGLLALAGLAGVWFTNSRGGILGAAIAIGAFACVALMVAKRKGSRWFAPALISIPIIIIAAGAFLLMGWKKAQDVRQAGSGISQLLDNNARLFFLNHSMSCIGLHPMSGGGARSFSWECYRFVDADANGDIITHKPDFVHNELIQSATDYGIIGASLLVLLLVVLSNGGVLRAIFEKRDGTEDSYDAWTVGGMAALAGMMVQSCFSFVFHLLPGILLLGICLAQISRHVTRDPDARTKGNRILLSLVGLAVAALLLPAGVTGTRVTKILWPTHFGKQEVSSAEARIDTLTDALRILPSAAFYQERGEVFQLIANSRDKLGFKEPADRAINDYQEASRYHPFDPGPVVNRANLLSHYQLDEEAEKAFATAIQLQGGMEPGYRARFSLAYHLLRKGLRLYDPNKPAASHEALEAAASQMELACKSMHYVIKEMLEPRVFVHENLGTAREATGDPVGALESYNFASNLEGGTRVHYRAGVLIGKMAREAWAKRRPSEALYHYIDAKKRVGLARQELPLGVTPSDRVEYLDFLDRRIEFLKGAKVEPMTVPDGSSR